MWAVPPDRGRRPRRPLFLSLAQPDQGSGAGEGARPTFRNRILVRREGNRDRGYNLYRRTVQKRRLIQPGLDGLQCDIY